MPLRVLLLADSHLGFDLPLVPRVVRRRRGHDFLANYARALEPALAGKVDVVVHAGDVFHRSRVHASLAHRAFEPLVRLADNGLPVFVVPGNHERSRLPHVRFARHRGIHVFDRPRTFTVEVRGRRIAFAGFPFERREIRKRFSGVLESTGWRDAAADLRFLCMHQCVEGATVGPADFTFTTAPDVIRCADLPAGLSAVLSGHIHRHQVLTSDLRGGLLAAPVLYPGSIERTSVAEKGEPKGFLIVDAREPGSDRDIGWTFRPLPARPMIVRELRAGGMAGPALDSAIRSLIAAAPRDAVLRVRVHGARDDAAGRVLSAEHLRAITPPTMNLEVRAGDVSRPAPGRRRNGGPRQAALARSVAGHQVQLEL